MTQAEKIRYLQLLNHVGFFVGLLYAFSHSTNYLYLGITLGFVFGILGINIGFHRYLSHNSFKTNKFFNFVLLYSGTLCLVGTPLTWAVSHINHHTFADKDGDPYSPHRLSLWNFLTTKFDPVTKPMLGAKNVMKNTTAMWLHRNYFLAIGIYCGVLLAIDPWLVIFAWSIPSIIALYILLITNIVCHMYGYKNHKTADQSHNNILMSILTFGEGWHNNHHANPSKWNQQDRWWELDPTSWIIWAIKK